VWCHSITVTNSRVCRIPEYVKASSDRLGSVFYHWLQILGVWLVPFSDSCDSAFSISIGGKWRQKKTHQRDGGLINRVTGLRVLVIIVEITWPVETQFTNIKPASIKKDLARTLEIVLIYSSGQVFIRASALDIYIVQQPREVNSFLRL
jgi:hypothetical protein